MNTKTTLYLVIVLALLGSGYVYMQSQPASVEVEPTEARQLGTPDASADLLEESLGEVVKVSCKRKDAEEWVFEKTTESAASGQGVWHMTSPMAMECVSWEIDRFDRELADLQYVISYKPGDPGAVTMAQAGLDPPEATVTLTDTDGESITIEIGKLASANETYVRLGDRDEICVGNRDLSKLIKDDPLGYRNQQLWSFDKNNVKRVEIDDRSTAGAPVSYAFVKDGARWMLESPVIAQATSKVDEMLTAMSRQRVTQWLANDTSKLSMYGLQNAAWSIRVTTEETVVVEPEEETAEEATEPPAPPQTETKTTVYELHVSDRAPIGEETKSFVRIGDESAVGSVLKSTVDKFKPVMNEWREMRITTANLASATRIEITNPGASATLVKKGRTWTFDPDGGRAEDQPVADLLKSAGELSAVVFMNDETENLAPYGLDAPQAELRLTIPGTDNIERIAIGGFTDATTKRLQYVRRNESASIAKVRAADIAKLIQDPRSYRDRTIVEVLPSRFEQITLSAPNPFADGNTEVVLQREGAIWHLASPVKADTQSDQMDKLMETLGGLAAVAIVGDDAQASAYGLHDPTVTVSVIHKPPVEYRVEDSGEGPPAEPVEVQPPSETITLRISKHDGKVYVLRSDRPLIYEVTQDVYTQFAAEYRADRVMDFDEAQVRRFSLRQGDGTHVFERTDGRWIYTAEPDLPLDSVKVDNLLLQIRDLRTQRFVRHAAATLSDFDLPAATGREVVVTLEDGTNLTLWISAQPAQASGSDHGFFAAVEGAGSVFFLTEDSVNRVNVSLDQLE